MRNSLCCSVLLSLVFLSACTKSRVDGISANVGRAPASVKSASGIYEKVVGKWRVSPTQMAPTSQHGRVPFKGYIVEFLESRTAIVSYKGKEFFRGPYEIQGGRDLIIRPVGANAEVRARHPLAAFVIADDHISTAITDPKIQFERVGK